MPIIVTKPVATKGKRDAKRHRQKQKDAIKKRLPEIIGEESIITGRRDKVVKIPIKSIQIPRFRSARDGEGAGVGQGSGKGHKPGDIAGEEPSEDFLETEVPIEELIELMLEDLGLPNLEEKKVREVEAEMGWRIKGITREGPSSLMHVGMTVREGIKRFWFHLRTLQKETGKDELTCSRALKQTGGIVLNAIELLKDPESIKEEADEIKAFPIIYPEDERYLKIQENTEYQSNAVLFAMMDVSYSMDELKKYLARSVLYWLVEFLRMMYKRVEICFIVHHAQAYQVSEKIFFGTRESGGTKCHTAYELADDLIDNKYPPEAWNTYVWHFSDGEDWSPEDTVEVIKKMLPKINMLGYGEIQPKEEGEIFFGADSRLWNYFRDHLGLEEIVHNDLPLLVSVKIPFLGVHIATRDDIYPALKEFLRKDRWAE
jgi:uncharacterized sporulation protein YeaH/YhbH (DUF444 family)